MTGKVRNVTCVMQELGYVSRMNFNLQIFNSNIFLYIVVFHHFLILLMTKTNCLA